MEYKALLDRHILKREMKHHFKPKSLPVRFLGSQGWSLNDHQVYRSMSKRRMCFFKHRCLTSAISWALSRETQVCISKWAGNCLGHLGLGWAVPWIRGATLPDMPSWRGIAEVLGFITQTPGLLHEPGAPRLQSGEIGEIYCPAVSKYPFYECKGW